MAATANSARFLPSHDRWLWLRVLIIAAGCAGLALGGFLLMAVLGSDNADPPVLKPASTEVRSGSLTLIAPRGWVRSAATPTVPGIPSATTIRLAHEGSSTYLVAAQLTPSSSTLLPAALLRRLDDAPGEPQRVELGGGLSAYYYSALWLRDSEVRMDVYVAPTTEGVATVACLSKVAYATSALGDCARAASGLRLARGYAMALSRDSAFWLRASAEIRAADGVRERARAQLGQARTPIEQSEAALQVSEAYRKAAHALEPMSSHSKSLGAVIDQLRANATSYTRISRHLRLQDASGLARDRQSAIEGETQLRALLRRQG